MGSPSSWDACFPGRPHHGIAASWRPEGGLAGCILAWSDDRIKNLLSFWLAGLSLAWSCPTASFEGSAMFRSEVQHGKVQSNHRYNHNLIGSDVSFFEVPPSYLPEPRYACYAAFQVAWFAWCLEAWKGAWVVIGHSQHHWGHRSLVAGQALVKSNLDADGGYNVYLITTPNLEFRTCWRTPIQKLQAPGAGSDGRSWDTLWRYIHMEIVSLTHKSPQLEVTTPAHICDKLTPRL